MKLGVMLEGQEGLTWDLWRRIMARVEELGFESLWRSDHFMSIVDSNRDVLETWVALTLTAAETSWGKNDRIGGTRRQSWFAGPNRRLPWRRSCPNCRQGSSSRGTTLSASPWPRYVTSNKCTGRHLWADSTRCGSCLEIPS